MHHASGLIVREQAGDRTLRQLHWRCLIARRWQVWMERVTALTWALHQKDTRPMVPGTGPRGNIGARALVPRCADPPTPARRVRQYEEWQCIKSCAWGNNRWWGQHQSINTASMSTPCSADGHARAGFRQTAIAEFISARQAILELVRHMTRGKRFASPKHMSTPNPVQRT